MIYENLSDAFEAFRSFCVQNNITEVTWICIKGGRTFKKVLPLEDGIEDKLGVTGEYEYENGILQSKDTDMIGNQVVSQLVAIL